jgi:radical SAM protein with 4Fe4S-binding SPASM domain
VLTGGEPFLRDDIAEIANFIHSQGRIVSIWTNGLLPERIYEAIKEMDPRPTQIGLSLNGSEETHDYTRGVKGNFKRVMKTRQYLLSLGINPYFKFTIMPCNCSEIDFMYRLSESMGTYVTFNLATPAQRISKNEGDSVFQFNDWHKDIIRRQLKRDNSTECIIRKLEGRLWFNCTSGFKRIFISPDGNVYPCNHYTDALRMGNVKEGSLDEIMVSPRTKEILNKIRKGECQPCYFGACFAAFSMATGGRLLSSREEIGAVAEN